MNGVQRENVPSNLKKISKTGMINVNIDIREYISNSKTGTYWGKS